jgi:hypothetical protein
MDVLRANQGLASIIAGTLFAIVLLLIGGSTSGVGVALALILGAVFGVSMYRALRRPRRAPPS